MSSQETPKRPHICSSSYQWLYKEGTNAVSFQNTFTDGKLIATSYLPFLNFSRWPKIILTFILFFLIIIKNKSCAYKQRRLPSFSLNRCCTSSMTIAIWQLNVHYSADGPRMWVKICTGALPWPNWTRQYTSWLVLRRPATRRGCMYMGHPRLWRRERTLDDHTLMQQTGSSKTQAISVHTVTQKNTFKTLPNSL